MARRILGISLLGIVLVAGTGAHAGTLTSATWLQLTEVRFGGLLPGIPLTRTSAQLDATGTSTDNVAIAVNLSYPAFATTVFAPRTPSRPVDLAVQVMQGGPQAITATPGMGNGTPGIPGTVIVMSALHQAMGVNQSMFNVGAITYITVPLSHGKAGVFTTTYFAGGIPNAVTVEFYAWTPGTLTFTGLTAANSPLPNVTAMGSFALAPNGAGTVTLVSPSRVTIVSDYYNQRTVGLATLKLTFVPEPGTLLLLGGGLLALAFVARRPRRSARRTEA